MGKRTGIGQGMKKGTLIILQRGEHACVMAAKLTLEK